VYIRLGDLFKMEGKAEDAKTEYEKALTIRSRLFALSDRQLCDVYYCLATSLIECAGNSQLTETMKQDKKRIALQYYEQARQVHYSIYANYLLCATCVILYA
jgi:hypothetical protein